MNERIEELMKQAGLFANDVGSSNIDERMREFGKLVVKECVGVSDAYVRGDIDSPSYSPTARSRIGIKIQEHFGIQK